jgi:Ca2+-binding RTX toxin-like protein
MALNPINGTADAEALPGTILADSIRAGAGDDTVEASDSNDRVFGETGDDWLDGGFGDDVMIGGGGKDVLIGEHGDDRLYGGAGDDFLWGGNYYEGNYERLWGGDGDDLFYVSHQSSSEVHGDGGIDTLSLFWFDSSRDLRVTLALNGAAANTIEGGAGADSLIAGAGNGAFVLQVTGATATDNLGSTISGFEHYRFNGGYFGDAAYLGDGNDRFYGHRSNDIGYGYGGNDALLGQSGNDSLFGGDGRDLLAGGPGEDQLTGGAGKDRFRFTHADAADLITDLQAGSDRVEVSTLITGDALAAGAVGPGQFSVGSASGEHGQFVLDGNFAEFASALYWDANGAAAGGMTLIAILQDKPALTAADLLII